jgi:hypothetical protein
MKAIKISEVNLQLDFLYGFQGRFVQVGIINMKSHSVPNIISGGLFDSKLLEISFRRNVSKVVACRNYYRPTGCGGVYYLKASRSLVPSPIQLIRESTKSD